MNVTFSIQARTDLIDIGEWIARENGAQATLYVAKLRLACEQIGERPKLYPFVREGALCIDGSSRHTSSSIA